MYGSQRPAAIRTSSRIPAQIPSGTPTDGDAPGCCLAIRTLSAPGRMRKRSGGSSFAASPSMPAGTGARRLDLERPAPTIAATGAAARSPRARAALGGRLEHGDPQHARRRAVGRVPEPMRATQPVAVVGDEDRRAGACARARPARASEVEPGRRRARAHRARCRAGCAASRRGSRVAARPRRRGRARRC